MKSDWDGRAEWWAAEVAEDPAYAADVHPILVELLPGEPGVTMDLGCGEGQGMRLVGRGTFGCDLSISLLRRAAGSGSVVQTRLPDLGWLRDGSLDTASSVYLLDLIEDYVGFFRETARVVRGGGVLVIVINHPAYTAPGSAPLTDPDGEILWRWGSYFDRGSSLEPAGAGEVEFFHRPMADLLTTAAASGWVLDVLIERGLSAETIARFPEYVGQEHIPRLLGVRWTRSR
ncbi:MAG: class I SAM-dependent methyltransferase [Actinomycetota bacterium]|nr:class I SAM-dependent methyltransferase [Actinomycetota bacterium]MDK1039348.1 class I SAM-dependent methyltransferase [Actinomycetota bacterium]MDK1097478.1 class I SAM-dependent methyltransferase [Actinomycetota bacterium]MDK1292631.1 class I SAM-dependent methyltransferase [Actinomycetota bacterium]